MSASSTTSLPGCAPTSVAGRPKPWRLSAGLSETLVLRNFLLSMGVGWLKLT